MNPSETPRPPALHWAILLVLNICTFGLFGYFWMFRQARFANKLDPANRAILAIAAAGLIFLVANGLSFANAYVISQGGESTDLGVVTLMLRLWQFLAIATAYLKIRETLTRHYGVNLNKFLTVIFNVIYIQYHLRKIAAGSRPETAPQQLAA